jgi:hypothetical protein
VGLIRTELPKRLPALRPVHLPSGSAKARNCLLGILSDPGIAQKSRRKPEPGLR